jgi:hypothetical protein
MVGGGDKEDIEKLKDKETVKDLWKEFDKDFNKSINMEEANILNEDEDNYKIYEIIKYYLKMKKGEINKEYLKNELKKMKPSNEEINSIIKNFDQIYEELPYQKEEKEEVKLDDVKLEETDGEGQGEGVETATTDSEEKNKDSEGQNTAAAATEEKEEENKDGERQTTQDVETGEEQQEEVAATEDNKVQLPGYLAKLFDISGVGKKNINDETIVYFNIKDNLNVTDTLLYLNNNDDYNKFLYQEDKNVKNSLFYNTKLIDLIKKIQIKINDNFYMLESKELKEEEKKRRDKNKGPSRKEYSGKPIIFSIIEKLIVRDIIQSQKIFNQMKDKNNSKFLNVVGNELQPNEEINGRTLFRIHDTEAAKTATHKKKQQVKTDQQNKSSNDFSSNNAFLDVPAVAIKVSNNANEIGPPINTRQSVVKRLNTTNINGAVKIQHDDNKLPRTTRNKSTINKSTRRWNNDTYTRL